MGRILGHLIGLAVWSYLSWILWPHWSAGFTLLLLLANLVYFLKDSVSMWKGKV